MTPLSKEDVVKYIIKIKLNFENAYNTSDDFERQLLVESWFEALCEYPKEVCDLAVNNALKRAKFAPRLGDITEEIEKILRSDDKTDEELWIDLIEVLPKVYEASRYLQYPQYYKWAQSRLTQLFNGLNKEIQLYLVNASTLIEIAKMNNESLTFEKVRFIKQIPILRKKITEREQAKLLLDKINYNKSLPYNKKDD